MGIVRTVLQPAVNAVWRAAHAVRASAGPLAGVTIETPEQLEAFVSGALGAIAASGAVVTPDSAMRVSTVYACVRVLAQSVAKLPLNLYQRDPKDRRVKQLAVDHPLYLLLHYAPNGWQTSFQFRQMLMGHLCLRGNAYAYITRSRGRVVELVPIHPDRVSVRQLQDLSIEYTVAQLNGGVRTFKGGAGGEILHLRGLSTDGVKGLSPIRHAREAIGLALSTERHAAKVFTNAARLGGLLKSPKALGDEAFKRLREQFDELYSGAENAHKTAILEEGMDWVKVGMTAEDAQFIENRKFQRGEIAAFFGVPPHKIGDLERSTNNNIEHQALEFVIDSLMPWLESIEQDIWLQLLSEEEKATHFAKFNVDALLRGDAKSRAEALQIKRRNGVINANEWREIDDMNPRPDPGGEEYIVERNMGAQDGRAPKDNGGTTA